ncbi:MAG: class I SAM-dependent methyltransferase [Vallitalea sp.]|jgi:tRNA (adenine22-N1)-methyltransferase|nr:class I SAM-dependent methyltransferase [Vallitalea sp.]
MEISNRLKAISEMVDDGSIIGDIGTDHGYIPIYLAKHSRIKHAIACDINKEPLEIAKKNIKNHNVEEYIETRLSNGLDKINRNEVDTIIIAGMGGILIKNILSCGSDVIQTVDKLILSPQSDIDLVRKKIHELNFKISDERLLKDGGKYYNIICAVKGHEKKYNTIDYKYGKILIDKRSTILKEKLLLKKNKYTNLILNLQKQQTDNAIKRKDEIIIELDTINEVLKCL